MYGRTAVRLQQATYLDGPAPVRDRLSGAGRAGVGDGRGCRAGNRRAVSRWSQHAARRSTASAPGRPANARARSSGRAIRHALALT